VSQALLRALPASLLEANPLATDLEALLVGPSLIRYIIIYPFLIIVCHTTTV
jgi:hypothetical protein